MGKPTGPRTPRGKARSSQNAGKHWIESGRILPNEQGEAANLHCDSMNEFKPGSVLEREIVNDMVLNRLIKRRIDIAFTREFSKAAVEKTITLTENAERAVTQYFLRLSNLRGLNGSKPDHAERLRPANCVAGLEGLIGQISDRGPQPQDFEVLRQLYGDQPTEQAALAMNWLRQVAAKRLDGNGVSETFDEKELQEEVLAALQIEIDRQGIREELETALHAIECKPNHPQEPPGPTLETLLRYRASNIRELEQLLGIFERARRIRMGES
jgi:hypothetical protein